MMKSCLLIVIFISCIFTTYGQDYINSSKIIDGENINHVYAYQASNDRLVIGIMDDQYSFVLKDGYIQKYNPIDKTFELISKIEYQDDGTITFLYIDNTIPTVTAFAISQQTADVVIPKLPTSPSEPTLINKIEQHKSTESLIEKPVMKNNIIGGYDDNLKSIFDSNKNVIAMIKPAEYGFKIVNNENKTYVTIDYVDYTLSVFFFLYEYLQQH